MVGQELYRIFRAILQHKSDTFSQEFLDVLFLEELGGVHIAEVRIIVAKRVWVTS